MEHRGTQTSDVLQSVPVKCWDRMESKVDQLSTAMISISFEVRRIADAAESIAANEKVGLKKQEKTNQKSVSFSVEKMPTKNGEEDGNGQDWESVGSSRKRGAPLKKQCRKRKKEAQPEPPKKKKAGTTANVGTDSLSLSHPRCVRQLLTVRHRYS